MICNICVFRICLNAVMSPCVWCLRGSGKETVWSWEDVSAWEGGEEIWKRIFQEGAVRSFQGSFHPYRSCFSCCTQTHRLMGFLSRGRLGSVGTHFVCNVCYSMFFVPCVSQVIILIRWFCSRNIYYYYQCWNQLSCLIFLSKSLFNIKKVGFALKYD